MMVVDTLFADMGISLPDYVLIVTAFSALIFTAKDLRLGVMFLFFCLGIETIVFYAFSYDVTRFVVSLLLSFVLLTFMLFTTSSKPRYGVV